MAEEQSSTAVAEPQASETTTAPEVFEPTTPKPGTYPTMDWRQGVSPLLRDDPQYNKTLEVYPDFNTFVRDAIGWRRTVSQSVRLPSEQATDEDWQGFFKKLPGYLDKPNDYVDAIKLPSLAAEGEEATEEWDMGLLQDIYTTAHAHGILPRQLQPIIDAYARAAINAKHVFQADEAKLKHDQKLELQRRFGGNVVIQENKARDYFQRSHDTELGHKVHAKLAQAGLLDDPDIVQFYALQAERFGEPAELLGGTGGVFPIQTREEQEAELTRLASQAHDPKLSHAEQLAAVAAINRIHERALTLRR